MDKIIERVLQGAKAKGACKLTEGVTDIDSLSRLFLTPQGREFCISNEYPNRKDWALLRTYHLQKYGIYCEMGHVSVADGETYAAIGKTTLDARFGANNGVTHHIILMHGAKATLHLSNYAVVKIEATGDCTVDIDNEDETAIVLW